MSLRSNHLENQIANRPGSQQSLQRRCAPLPPSFAWQSGALRAGTVRIGAVVTIEEKRQETGAFSQSTLSTLLRGPQPACVIAKPSLLSNVAADWKVRAPVPYYADTPSRSGLPAPTLRHTDTPAPHPATGATLLEVLGVIAVIGFLSAAAIPAIRSYTPDPLVVASRQLLNDLAFARQRAIADHTTVFVVFIPALDNLRPELRAELPPSEIQRLLAGQFVSYALYEKRGVGDQPDLATPLYLTDWKPLPPGTAIARQKFGVGVEPAAQTISPDLYPTFDYINSGKIYFNPQNGFYPSGFSSFPTVAFDYQGRLVSHWEAWHGFDCVIPLTRGTVNLVPGTNGYAPVPATFTEDPPGNWNTSQTQVVIDGPTGRARLVRKQ